MTFPFRRRKRPRTFLEEREFATVIRSAEVAAPRMRSTRGLEEIRAEQARRRARREAFDADGEA